LHPSPEGKAYPAFLADPEDQLSFSSHSPTPPIPGGWLGGGQQESEGSCNTAYVCFMFCTPCSRVLSLREKKMLNSISGTGNELSASLKHKPVYMQGSAL